MYQCTKLDKDDAVCSDCLRSTEAVEEVLITPFTVYIDGQLTVCSGKLVKV